MAKLNQQETEAYLAEPHIGHLVTVRPDGRPHVAPVWFKWEGDRALVMAIASAVKLRNIQHNPAVALSIATDQRPYRYVILEGEARVTGDAPPEVIERLCIHYDGPDRGPDFARELIDDRHLVLIDIKITRVIPWYESKETRSRTR